MAFYAVGWGFDNRDFKDRVRKPLSLFFFFKTVSSLPQPLPQPLQAAEIEELSYVKKHLDVYDLKMSVLIVCLDAYTILATMKSLME